ncbi:MAG: hydrolase 1, exosortase A system-associated [Rhodocyclaceae bacterium]|nr:hydrolase 1, exosortase A system-associated [Rhodocyclaceae bacterium]
MSVTETAHLFRCGSESLVGIVSHPSGTGRETGVVIVVGGPQYRIGSHRQFALLARALAAAGHPALRFDYRGMGDSTGPSVAFDAVDADIAAAIDLLQAAHPGVRRVALWGLCDGASAALLYAHRSGDRRIAGVALANPWLHSDQARAHATVHMYYRQRFFEMAFWRKLLRGGINPWRSMRELAGHRRQARLSPATGGATTIMLGALSELDLPMLFLLCRRDPTAREFLAQLDLAKSTVLSGAHVSRADFAEADHTFSRAEWRKDAENATIAWLNGALGRP